MNDKRESKRNKKEETRKRLDFDEIFSEHSSWCQRPWLLNLDEYERFGGAKATYTLFLLFRSARIVQRNLMDERGYSKHLQKGLNGLFFDYVSCLGFCLDFFRGSDDVQGSGLGID